jgi:ketosteroid isomerase-like protein
MSAVIYYADMRAIIICFAVGMLGMRPEIATAQDVRATDRARVADSVRVFLRRYIAAYESRDIRAVMALYPNDGPVSSANDGKITTSRDSLAAGIGRFLGRLKVVSFSTEPPIVTVIDPHTAAITLAFHGTGTWSDGGTFSTNGSWTAILSERDGRLTIIQEQESHPRG